MEPVSEVVLAAGGDTILVEMGLHAGFGLTAHIADDLVFDKPIKHLVPLHSKRLETTGVKTMTITLQYKHAKADANLGFFRSSLHR
jgi:hypothetical protein